MHVHLVAIPHNLQRMALNSFQLFLSQIQAAPEVLKLRVLQIVFDVLMVHDGEFLGRGSASVRGFFLPIYANSDVMIGITGRAHRRIFATRVERRRIGQSAGADVHRSCQACAVWHNLRREGTMVPLLPHHTVRRPPNQVLKSLVVAYLSPDTVQNQELRQCLSYFFPVLCYSASANQRRMAQVRALHS